MQDLLYDPEEFIGVGSASRLGEVPITNKGGGNTAHPLHGPCRQSDSTGAYHNCATPRGDY